MMRRLCLSAAAAGLLGSTGCGLLCDRYCDRERERCDRHCQNRCVPMNCNSSPVDHCAPAAGNTYYANPNNCR